MSLWPTFDNYQLMANVFYLYPPPPLISPIILKQSWLSCRSSTHILVGIGKNKNFLFFKLNHNPVAHLKN